MEKQEKCIIGGNLGHTVPSIHSFIGLLSQEACPKVASQERKKKKGARHENASGKSYLWMQLQSWKEEIYLTNHCSPTVI